MTGDQALWLENEWVRVRLDRTSGAIAGLTSRSTGWDVLGRPELGTGFRLLLPLQDRRNNVAASGDQEPPRLRRAADHTSVTLTWRRLRSRHGGQHDIVVTQTVRLSGPQVIFEMSVDNRSDLPVENAWTPCLRGIRAPDGQEKLASFFPDYGGAKQYPVLPTFTFNTGYYGVDVPTHLGSGPYPAVGAGIVPISPFMLLLSESEGLYVGVAARSFDVVAWALELAPGYEDSLDRRAPAAGAIGGHDVALTLSAAHAPFILPGEKRDLTPIAIQPFAGDWHAGADIYRRARDAWFVAAQPPRWAAEPGSWLQLHVNSPEDELRAAYRDLPQVGRQCADAGIGAIQLVGWNEGGQDQGNPSHRPDPRLGTEDELRSAIRTIQIEAGGRKANRRYRLVDGDGWLDAGNGITLPARSAAVVLG